MALKFVESFDHLTVAQLTRKWTSSSGGALTTGRNATNGLRLAGASEEVSKTLASSHASGVIGFAFLPIGHIDSNHFLEILDGATRHLTLRLDTSGHLVATRNGTVLATGTAVISLAAYTYVEIKFTINDATGAVEVRLNGSASPDINVSGVDTRNGATATWNTFAFSSVGTITGASYDDIYVLDGSGAANNDFLGDCRVECLLPSTGNGSNTDFTPSTGSDHGALVDEATPNDDTDYNASATVGHLDTYNYPSLSGTPEDIFGIQVLPCVRKTDAGARDVAPVVKSGATTSVGTTVSPSTGYLYYPQIYETDPNTAAPWVSGGIDALEAGLKVIA